MMLLTQKIGDGPVRRCDARCYNAHGGECDCICGGRNHGAGVDKALDNVREMFLGENGPNDAAKGLKIEVTRRAQRAIHRAEYMRSA